MNDNISTYISIALFLSTCCLIVFFVLMLKSQRQLKEVSLFHQNLQNTLNFIVACASLLATLYISKVTNDLTITLEKNKQLEEEQKNLSIINDEFETIRIISSNISYFKGNGDYYHKVGKKYYYDNEIIDRQFEIIKSSSVKIKNASSFYKEKQFKLANKKADNIYKLCIEFSSRLPEKYGYLSKDFIIINHNLMDVGYATYYEQGITNEALYYIQRYNLKSINGGKK